MRNSYQTYSLMSKKMDRVLITAPSRSPVLKSETNTRVIKLHLEKHETPSSKALPNVCVSRGAEMVYVRIHGTKECLANCKSSWKRLLILGNTLEMEIMRPGALLKRHYVKSNFRDGTLMAFSSASEAAESSLFGGPSRQYFRRLARGRGARWGTAVNGRKPHATPALWCLHLGGLLTLTYRADIWDEERGVRTVRQSDGGEKKKGKKRHTQE